MNQNTPPTEGQTTPEPLWSDGKIIDVVSTAADNSRVDDHLLEADGVAIMLRLRDAWERDRAALQQQLDELKAELAEASRVIALMHPLHGFVDGEEANNANPTSD